MRKQLLLLKALLVAVLLGVGTSASWGATNNVYKRAIVADPGNNVVAWSSSDIASGKWQLTTKDKTYYPTFGISETLGLQIGTAARSAEATNTGDISLTPYSILTIDVVLYTGDANGNGSNRNYFKIGNKIEFSANTQNQWGYVTLNGTNTTITNACSNGKSSNGNGNRTNDTWTIHMVINTLTKVVTSLTVSGSEGTNKATLSLSSQSLGSDATFNSLALGFARSGGTPGNMAIKSISIVEETQEVETPSYTINYEYNGNVIKTVEGEDAIGAVVDAESPITIGGQKYYAKDGETTSMTIVDGDNTLNVDLRKANEWNYTVKSSLGTTLLSDTGTEGEVYSYSYPRYILNGTTLYQSHAQGDPYTDSFTLDENNKEVTITYSATDKTNICNYIEGEDVEGVTVNTSATNVGIRASGAAVADGNDVKILTLPAGSYKFTIGQFMSRSNYDGTVTLNFGGQSFSYKTTTVNLTESTSAEYTLPSATDLTFTIADNGHLDYLYIEKTAVAAPISEFGKSTFSSTYPVDIANATPAGLKAYKATAADASSVHMVEVTEAVAGMTGNNKTGLLLVGTPSTTYYIPIATTSGSVPSGNLLFGWNSSLGNLGVADSGTNFVLSVQNDEVVWAPIKSAAAPLATGQAGLWADVEINTSRSLRMVFGDNSVTGISDATRLKEKGQMTNGVFNLNGQRVKKAAKGLYIVNGKKYIK